MTDGGQVPPGLLPVRFPELGGIEVGWAMCRNRLCTNFGVLYGTHTDTDGVDLCYDLETDTYGQIVAMACKWCELKIALYSPRSLRPLVRHFLSCSLPFADCPHEDCDNHGINAFDYYGGTPARPTAAPYRPHRKTSLRCTLCEKNPDRVAQDTFSLGTAVKLDRKRDGWSLGFVLDNVWKGYGLRGAMQDEVPPAVFYRHVERAGNRMREYHAYRNAFLLQPGFAGKEGADAIVQTDVIKASLRRFGTKPARSQLVNIILSVLRLKKTFFVLAAHPLYMPEAKCPTAGEIEDDFEGSEPIERRLEGFHSLNDETEIVNRKTGDVSRAVVDAGHKGLFLRTPYAEVAHFLVVQRMLSRFKRTFHYMDASYDLSLAVQIALREDIRSGRAQVALFQFSKKKKDRPRSWIGTPREEALDTGYSEMEQRFDELVEKAASQSDLARDKLSLNRERAKLWAKGPLGANDPNGGFAWLDFPTDRKLYPKSRTLWLSRKPTDTLEDGKELLLPTSLQRVDSLCSSLRARVDSFNRPKTTASGIGFIDSNVLPEVLLAELAIYQVRRNYGRLPLVSKKFKAPAAVLGLADGTMERGELHEVFWDFDLTVDHAKEMSRWTTTA